jgi:hypothetical protein
VQQQPQPIVGEVAEAVPDPLHLLDQQVDGLGGPVGTAIGSRPSEDLGLSGSYGASQPGQLGDLDAIAPAVKAIQGGAGCWHADRNVIGDQDHSFAVICDTYSG